MPWHSICLPSFSAYSSHPTSYGVSKLQTQAAEHYIDSLPKNGKACQAERVRGREGSTRGSVYQSGYLPRCLPGRQIHLICQPAGPFAQPKYFTARSDWRRSNKGASILLGQGRESSIIIKSRNLGDLRLSVGQTNVARLQRERQRAIPLETS